jgi:hypothetical protein
MTYKISSHQYNFIQGFFAHLWSVRWEKSKNDFQTWAVILDGLGVPWYVQNAVSVIADERESAFLYLRPQLAKRNIFIEQ